MRPSGGYTDIGGANIRFPQTQWTEVIGISLGESIQNEFVQRYWKPIYSFLRRKGYDNEKAKDLTQGFFTEIVLDSNLFKNLDSSKGKFRTLLLTALNHYLVDVARHEKRKKRHPGMVVNLDETMDLPDQTVAQPEDAFDYAWATEVLDVTLSTLKAECGEGGLTIHWALFERRLLTPIIEEVEAPALADLLAEYELPNVLKASNMIITVKRRFRTILERTVEKYTDADADIALEIARLIELFGKGLG